MALWRVRGVVDPPADAAEPSPLRVSGTALGFNSDAAYWLDVEEFERLLRAVAPRPDGTLDEDDAQRLRSAIDLYAGDLLEDIYDDWCLYDRERLRLLYHGALERLMRFEEERSAWAAAIALGQRLLALDPLMEQVHREMMRCYVRRGSRAAALRQFESCARVLRAELDVDPMPETIDLYHPTGAGDLGLRNRRSVDAPHRGCRGRARAARRRRGRPRRRGARRRPGDARSPWPRRMECGGPACLGGGSRPLHTGSCSP
jgi:DNA-binding SARP family transcriptional activator